MFKQIFSATLLLFTSALLSAQGINFETGNWAQVAEKAKAENKYIFVDAYAEWCGPCKWMAKNVFTDSKVGAHFNSKYINYKFDMEKGEGPEFAKKYSVNAYPTLLFFNADGELVHKVLGASPAELLITQSEKALDPSQQIFSMKKKFESGDKNPEFLYSYLIALRDASEETAEVADLYLKTLKKEDWKTEANFDIISFTQFDIKSEIFKYVIANRAAFEKSVGKQKLESYIDNVFNYEINNVAEAQDATSYKDLKTDITQLLGDKAKSKIALLDWQYNMGKKEEFKFTKIYFDKYCENANQLNSIAWYYFENFSNKKELKAALNWVNRSISLNKNWYNLDTKANLLNKLGKKKDALATAEEALAVAIAAGEDPSETEKLIRDLKK